MKDRIVEICVDELSEQFGTTIDLHIKKKVARYIAEEIEALFDGYTEPIKIHTKTDYYVIKQKTKDEKLTAIHKRYNNPPAWKENA